MVAMGIFPYSLIIGLDRPSWQILCACRVVSKENDFVVFKRVQYCTVMVILGNLGAGWLKASI
jgi:hypothetical protein